MRMFQGRRELIVAAPAKINLFLELAGKRDDGYHEIATLMAGITLRDTLGFQNDPTGALTLTTDRPDLSTGPDNLVVKAAQLLKTKTGLANGARIRLKKRIPMAAGLAGGSTDAVATLLGLNRLWNANVGVGDLARWSAELGSDMPFFFSLPAAWCTGRGEIIEPLRAARSFDAVLILPPFGCHTASVYRNVSLDGTVTSGQTMRQAFAAGDVEKVARAGFNRLEPAALKVAPELATIRGTVAKIAPLGCLMSGSGSTLFALVKNRNEARELIGELSRRPELSNCDYRAVRTLCSKST